MTGHGSNFAMNPNRRGFLRLAGLGAVAVGGLGPLLSACGSDDGGSGAERTTAFEGVTMDDVKSLLELDQKHMLAGETMRIGALLPLSGAGTYYGEVQSNGLKLAAKHIEAMGGPKVELVMKDHKSGDPQAAVSAFRELRADGVEFIVSSYIAAFYALLPAFKAEDCFVLEGGQQGITNQVEAIPHYWSGTVSTDGYYPHLFRYISEKYPDVKKIASISVDVGEAVRNAARITLTEAAEKYDIEVVMEEYVPYGTTEFTTLITQAQSKSPDAMLNGISPGGGLFAKQMRQSGLTIPQFGINLAVDDVKVGGSALDNFEFASYWLSSNAPASKFSQFFVNEWDKAYGTEPLKPDAYGSIMYDIGFQFWQLGMAASKAGKPVNQQTFNEIAGSTTVKSVFGGSEDAPGLLAWDAETHFPSGEIGMFELNSGEINQLARSDWDGETGFELMS
ncbi:ABC transporter substrate-binding protein [Nocardioides marmotae]|uniref:ABC transporter substrate-binding protein n=1 Tax=Nocardioides marmotae TaxID=2663857 RepID=UPI0016596891|nr:ABC transporter substrate-binding protein [Nocardioides marmotae]MBC9732347.1 ABC transporter substrate-binding protein [Nocardioides marmotae]